MLANVGEGYELRALASAIIGGELLLEGGRGTVLGAFLGVRWNYTKWFKYSKCLLLFPDLYHRDYHCNSSNSEQY